MELPGFGSIESSIRSKHGKQLPRRWKQPPSIRMYLSSRWESCKLSRFPGRSALDRVSDYESRKPNRNDDKLRQVDRVPARRMAGIERDDSIGRQSELSENLDQRRLQTY